MAKNWLFIGVLVSSFIVQAKVPHLDPDMTGREFRALLSKARVQSLTVEPDAEDLAIAKFLAIGKRNLDWIDLINQNRKSDQQVSLSSEATQNGSPVWTPRIYNFEICKQKWEIVESLLPQVLKDVVFGTGELPTSLPVSDRMAIEWLAQVDSAYQLMARYKLYKPYLFEMAEGAKNDVRGYLILSGTEKVNDVLNDYEKQTPAAQDRYRKALVMVCMNAQLERFDCQQKFSDALAAKQLVQMKDTYLANGKEVYDAFFNIPKSRTDTTWTAENPNVLSIPFTNPKNAVIQDFLTVNIQEEWKWKGWQLILNFVDTESPTTTHMVFQAGVVPHVDDIAGSTITMDANAPLSEYDVRWTIRHEFGHVLGFPDCYHEFYDEELAAMVSYQLDVTNLMCSRRGKLQQRHFDELKRVYFK